MDNRRIDVRSEGREAFDLAVRLLFDNCPGGKATHYYRHAEKGLVFCWHGHERATELPVPLGWQSAANLAWTWLASVPDNKRDEYIDHDGSNGHGFHVYCEEWGHVGSDHYAFMAVRAIWAWYGK